MGYLLLHFHRHLWGQTRSCCENQQWVDPRCSFSSNLKIRAKPQLRTESAHSFHTASPKKNHSLFFVLKEGEGLAASFFYCRVLFFECIRLLEKPSRFVLCMLAGFNLWQREMERVGTDSQTDQEKLMMVLPLVMLILQ